MTTPTVFLARFLAGTFLLAAPAVIFAAPPAGFAPRFYAFENGVLFGDAAEQARVLKELGYDSLGSAKPHDLPARIEVFKKNGLRISSLYVGGKLGAGVGDHVMTSDIPAAIRQLEGHGAIIELFVQGKQDNTDEQAVAFVREVADLAKASGMRVALYPHAGFYIETFGDAVRVARLSGRDNVGAMFNLCHFLKVEPESDLRATLKSAGDLLWRVSTSGADLGGTGWNELIQPLDRGSFDQAAFLRLLREIGFDGEVGLQCYQVPGDQKENLKRSIDAWRKYLALSREG